MSLSAAPPPQGVRNAFATTSIFSCGKRGAGSTLRPRYYDANLDWVPTTPLRQAMRRLYPFLLSTFLYMEACGQYLVWLLSVDDSGFDDAENRRRDQRSQQLLYGGQNSDSEEEAEEMRLVLEAGRGRATAKGSAGAKGPVELAVIDSHRGDVGREHFSGPVRSRRVTPLCGFPLEEIYEEDWN
ncbi:hypothetical protein TraAM80_07847 [Trypanosoma rangeli]|uniref:Uncharacterized protein n=1 Tax=Trypanosoma rangeli TaxID=5698 RepID=A0A422N3F5_TRYRA|nr:uncharacterized protein TraAM80_07847 [Trypanosoma rangeli]RNF00019.1 hypothetical protein TraAM80_07847 [Trypanosoma rangeli]|eukprot:RNF00019.1 hypothetical protein TraAM80_07847 [Trypanosoma rangeli]